MADTLSGLRVLITTDAVGGVWTYSLDLARELGKAGIETIVAVIGPPPNEKALEATRDIANMSLVAAELPLDWMADSMQHVLDAGRVIASLAEQFHCDLVQLHTPAFAAGGGFGVPVLSVHHSCVASWWRTVKGSVDLPTDLAWRAALVGKGLRMSDAVVAPTTAFAHDIASLYGLPTPPLAIHNGRRDGLPGEVLDPQRRAPFVLTSGRLWDEGKNAATLDRTAALLNVPLVAAGAVARPGGEAVAFSALRVMGELTAGDLNNWLSQAPIFVSAARYEPFGLGVLEAAQAGCALVLSDIPGYRELWSGAALFVPAEDEQAFARTINRLFSDAGLLRRLSERAVHRTQLYRAQTMAGEMMRLYQNIIALHRIGRGAAA